MSGPLYVPKQPERSEICHVTPTVDLYYELRGISKNAKVVLLMGAMATMKHFGELADSLADKYEVLTFDYRGVGKSKVQGMQPVHTSELYAADTMALLDHVWGPSAKVHIYAVSMGGWVAQALALRLVPLGRLASLFMGVTTRGNPISLPLPLWLCRFLASKTIDPDPARQTAKLLQQCYDPEVLARVAVLASEGKPASTYGELWFKKWVEHYDELFTFRNEEVTTLQVALCVRHKLTTQGAKLLRASGAPITVLIGTHDVVMPPKGQHALAEMVGAEKLVVESGHMAAPEYMGTIFEALCAQIDKGESRG